MISERVVIREYVYVGKNPTRVKLRKGGSKKYVQPGQEVHSEYKLPSRLFKTKSELAQMKELELRSATLEAKKPKAKAETKKAPAKNKPAGKAKTTTAKKPKAKAEVIEPVEQKPVETPVESD